MELIEYTVNSTDVNTYKKKKGVRSVVDCRMNHVLMFPIYSHQLVPPDDSDVQQLSLYFPQQRPGAEGNKIKMKKKKKKKKNL